MSRLPFANALSTALSLLPAADLTGVSELSMSEMCAWSATKADEYHRHTLTFHAIQNILAPVHRLPPEILSRIFIEAWQDRKSLLLTHVCRLWRTILLDTSQFWAVAIAGDEFRLSSDGRGVSDEDYLAAACARSAPRNISLHLTSISPRVNIMQYADRITSMKISAHTRDQLELLWNMLHLGIPCLERLAVRASTSIRGWAGPRKLSTQELPLLTHLSLPARLFRRSWPNTLQEIALRSDDDHSPFMVSLDMVLMSLEDYPRLRALDVRDSALFHDPHSRPPSRAFPKLELLRVRSSRPAVSAMLSLLSFPPSTRVEIRVVPGQYLPQGDLFVPGSALDAVAALVNQVTIQCGPVSTVRGHTDGAVRVRVTASFDVMQFEQDIRLFARTGAPVLRLLLAQHSAQHMPTMSEGQLVFPAFPHLTHLVLHTRSSVCAELLNALYPPLLLYSESESEAESKPKPESALGLPLLPLLRDLTVGFATKRHSEISKELRRVDVGMARKRHDYSAVVTHFRECYGLLRGVLFARARRGYRLSRFEFFSYEEGCMALKSDPRAVSHVDLAAVDHKLVEGEIAPIRRWVRGPVTFSGYWFFTEA